ncbi:M56 family metallopeptidase [Runella sp. SP2]|uniref:M56 family metallopeptidase n=1 Tax=Runella sp. SP2 TaxID=2268026 RepID=UPI000F097FA8|nr:M56 family metallopeptidase [Runella sp. SP2]AYQ35917.1 hypothetical protein DTQ70_28820 [Runella sp. SP2]
MILYVLKFTVVSAVLLMVYHFLLRKEKVYVFSRFFLVFGLAFAALVPFVPIQLPSTVAPVPTYLSHETAIISPNLTPKATTTPPFVQQTVEKTTTIVPSLEQLVGGLYLLVASLLFVRFVQNLWLMRKSIGQHPVVRQGQLRIVLLPQAITPYSFWNYVFVNETEYQQGSIEPEIWQHEEAHIRQKHTFDILWSEFFKIIGWFNPAVWYYRHAIALNHEFLADEWVLRAHPNPPVYQYLLLHRLCHHTHLALSSSFNYKVTKTRFAMMQKNTTPLRAFGLKAAAFAVLLGVGIAFADLSWAQTPAPPTIQPASSAKAPSNPDGASPEMITEYQTLVNKYVTKGVHNGKEWSRLDRPNETDRARLEVLFKSMSETQQLQQQYAMNPPLGPLPRITPTEKEFESYKNPKIYGLWIDGKKVPNSVLNNYKASDFSQVFISRLYKNAQATIGYKYKFQLDLETTAYYEKNRAETLADKRYYLGFNMAKWKKENAEKGK